MGVHVMKKNFSFMCNERKKEFSRLKEEFQNTKNEIVQKPNPKFADNVAVSVLNITLKAIVNARNRYDKKTTKLLTKYKETQDTKLLYKYGKKHYENPLHAFIDSLEWQIEKTLSSSVISRNVSALALKVYDELGEFINTAIKVETTLKSFADEKLDNNKKQKKIKELKTAIDKLPEDQKTLSKNILELLETTLKMIDAATPDIED